MGGMILNLCFIQNKYSIYSMHLRNYYFSSFFDLTERKGGHSATKITDL